MIEDPQPDPIDRRLSKRTQLVLVAAAFTIFIGFCVVPCVLFGGFSAVEQFFPFPVEGPP
jgi:uncharacterized sodium:solute symporter family permease YidK